MGYQAQIVFDDHRGVGWLGRYSFGVVELETLFRSVVALDVERLVEVPEAAPELWHAVLPPGVELARLLGPTSIHLRWPAGESYGEAVLKVSPAPSRTLGNRLKALWVPSRARRAYLTSHRLRAFGISTPRPLGFLERSRFPHGAASFSAFEFVRSLSLYEVRERLRNSRSFREKRSVLERVAACARSLHARGVLHGDLHPGNLLVTEEEILVVDLESVRSFGSRNRVVLKTLERLERDFAEAGLLTMTDRMRFLRTYLWHQGASKAGRRQLWREVETRSIARRAAVASTQSQEHV